jgi:hypothetical protein
MPLLKLKNGHWLGAPFAAQILMLRMQEKAFPGIKFQTFSGEYAPKLPYSCVVCRPYAWPSPIAIPL